MNLSTLFGTGSERPDSSYAWIRLWVTVVVATIGGIGMWSTPIMLPTMQAEFGVDRAIAALPYSVTMVGFMISGVILGRVVDRFGIFGTLVGGTAAVVLGYAAASLAPNIWIYILIQGLIGAGSAAFFAPLMADISHWFTRRRGIAVALCASGNYLAGTMWPPPLQYAIDTYGWRPAHLGIAVICLVTLLPFCLVLRRRAPFHGEATSSVQRGFQPRDLGISPNALQALLCIAGVACCAAMAMPQVHIVAYCGDLGYGVARGAEMLSLMLGFGIISRLASGFIADRIGGVATLLVGSALQACALIFYFLFDGLTSLYVISALFGLFQGGIVPSYAIIVREYFPPGEAAARIGLAIMATLFGMALGGWMSGAIFDLTGSYRAAFANGIAWNLINVSIALWLLIRSRRGPRLAAA